MPPLPPQVQVGLLLIGLGLTTYEKLKEVLTHEGADAETLAMLEAEYQRRLDRRADEPVG